MEGNLADFASRPETGRLSLQSRAISTSLPFSVPEARDEPLVGDTYAPRGDLHLDTACLRNLSAPGSR